MPMLILPVIGAAAAGGLASAGIIGASFLGVTAASWGWMAGSLLAGAFAPGQHAEGPRAGDLSAQTSNYGVAIPRHYGTNRIAGNVIFCTPKREVANKQKVGGKGGKKSTVTTYTYNVDMAIGLVDCSDGVPITGISRIWNNGKLIVDNTAGASVETLVASATRANGFKIYYGTATQLPDPTIEAYKGSGNVPGYHYLAYVVFDHLDCPNGQIPQYTFEVVKGGSTAVTLTTVSSPNNGAYGATGSAYIDSDFQMLYARTASGEVYGKRTDYFMRLNAVGWALDGIQDKAPQFAGGGGGDNFLGNAQEPGTVWMWRLPAGGAGNLIFQTPEGGIYVYERPTDFSYYTDRFLFAKDDDLFVWWNRNNNTVSVYKNDVYFSAWTVWSTNPPGQPALGTFVPPGTGLSVWLTDLAVYVAGGAYMGGTDLFVSRYDRDTLALIGTDHWASGTAGKPTGVDFAAYVQSPEDLILGSRATNKVWRYDGVSQWSFLLDLSPFFVAVTQIESLRLRDNVLAVGHLGGSGIDQIHFFNLAAITSTEYPVSEFIKTEAKLAGLTDAQLDVTTITDTFWGYSIGRLTSPRSAIEPVLAAFQIDTFESGGVRRFVKRKNQVIRAEIPYADLGSTEQGKDLDEPFPLVHTNAMELPRRLTASYINRNADYQVGSEQASRETVKSTFDSQFEIPFATTATHAATVAQILLYTAWAESNKRKTVLERKYIYLDASDHVMIEFPEGTWERWIISKYSDNGSLMTMEMTPADMSLYEGTAQGATPDINQEVTGDGGPTNLVVGDWAQLQDADNGILGPYVAMDGNLDSWPGAELLEGPDDLSLQDRGGVGQESPIGFCETALTDWRNNSIDQFAQLYVSMGNSELASATWDQVKYQDFNVAMVGAAGRWECIKFVHANDLGDGRYLLTGLVRGYLGTEWAKSTHQVGDRFVLLVAGGILKPQYGVAQLNTLRYFRGITYGRTLDSATSVQATPTGESARPLSATSLNKTIDAAGKINLLWKRRTRMSTSWWLGTVPLGEASEKYEIVIYSDNTFTTIKRTLTSTVENVDYTVADQTTDFGGVQAFVNVRIYQISDVVGRGRALTGTI